MIPEIGPGLTRDVGVCIAKVPPPLRFKEIKGRISDVQLRGSKQSSILGSAAQKNGLRYETKVQGWLRRNVPSYQASRQFTFRDETGFRSIIPDGYLLYDGITEAQLTIFEIKSRHTPDAWWQLEKLYKPVLKQWLAAYNRTPRICLVEVCRSFDPAIVFPVKTYLVKDFVALMWTIQESNEDFLVFELRP